MSEVPSGLFSDRGAWHGYAFHERYLFEVVDLETGRRSRLDVTGQVVDRRVRDDRLEATLKRGESVVLRFRDARTAEIRVDGHVAVRVDGDDSLRLSRDEPGVYLHTRTTGPRAGHDLDGLPRTLRWNWRAPLGDLRHGGAFPSPFSYRGFWAWDAWKLAAALPKTQAHSQVHAVLDHQRADGMIPDVVTLDARRNRWSNSKPPLAAWACAHHEGLLEEFREPLERYVAWWDANRRPGGERLYAYGGDDVGASRCESGWDNGTRYDDVTLRDGLQSVLSVDLNAWMCREKRLLGHPDEELESLVNEVFFHEDGDGGAYYDVTWPDLTPVPTLTAATWIPLATGLATESRAACVTQKMLDPRHFATPMPLPTVARSDARFDPQGFWRGSVWLDQAAFGVEALARYGCVDEARAFADRLLEAPGDWQCYDPLTSLPSVGVQPAVPQYSWTAAARERLYELADGRIPVLAGAL